MKTIIKSLLLILSFTFFIDEGFGQTSADYYESAYAKQELEDYKGAIADCNLAIGLETNDELLSHLYYFRGTCKGLSGNKEGCCEDFVISSRLGYNYATEMLNQLCN